MQAQRNATASGILRSLLRHGPQGRKRLADTTGTSFTTVTKVVTELLATGALVETVPTPTREAGRPEVPLDLPGPARAVIGVHFHPDHTTVAAFDLRGRELLVRSLAHRSQEFDLTRQVLADLDGEPVGIGLATGGGWQHGPPTGPNQWRMQEITTLVADMIELPVRVDTNVNALALEQHWWRGVDGDVLTVFVGRSIGVAQMRGDALHPGRFGRGGSVDHLTVPGSDAACPCGARGCVDATCSNAALHAAAVENGLLAATTPLRTLDNAAARQDPALRTLRLERSRALGRVLPTIIRLVEPDLTIVHGGLHGDEEISTCLTTARKRYHQIAATDVDLYVGELGLWARASAALALDSYFHQPWDLEEELAR